jgi:LemA protein
MPKKTLAIGCLGVLILAAILVFSVGTGTYNSLVKLDQAVRAQWAQVENVYQRRADLVPNLVETVKGAADFEKSTYGVTEARQGGAR